ncbi:unnamed protein product [Dovyalis caffra]|uniref:Rieske domain-containing protein n=1 Tax=Dovyalis caffra TaxID=77055 RepID=A0AAV1RUI2_9ROSI|nr:unnamed protein product [Dovyalis caffra]
MQVLRTSSVTSIHFPISISKTQFTKSNFFSTISSPATSSVSTESTEPPEAELEAVSHVEKFDWYAHWYPVMPVCDLDKRVPHAKKVMGLDLVVWWDRNECQWKVFNDSCPHRLAPLSEGRIDQWGRLQCSYHGWSFSGSGNCKFIPQAPSDDPPVTSPKLNSVWEGGCPVDLNVKKLDSRGFFKNQDHFGATNFIAPCISYASSSPGDEPEKGSMQETLIWIFPRNFGLGIDKVVPRWIFHMKKNLVFDSDLYLLHIQACFVPTKSDALLVAYRRWFDKYAGGQVDWLLQLLQETSCSTVANILDSFAGGPSDAA